MISHTTQGDHVAAPSTRPTVDPAHASKPTGPRVRLAAKAAHFLAAVNVAFFIRLIRFGTRDSLARLRKCYYALSPFQPKPSRDLESRIAAMPDIDLSELTDSTSIILDASYRHELGAVPLPQLLIVLALLRRRQPKIVLEIGTFCGTTTKAIALNLPGSTIHTVDLPLDYVADTESESAIPKDDFHLIQKRRVGDAFRDDPRCSNIIQHFADTADWDFEIVKGTTFILIDGSHTYEYCKNDSLKALAISGPCSLVVWHDCDAAHGGVVTFLSELISAGRKVLRVRGTPLAILETDGFE